MSMSQVIAQYERGVRRQTLHVSLLGIGIVLALSGVWGAFFCATVTLPCFMAAFCVFIFRAISIYDDLNPKMNVPDQVLRMIADEPTLSRRFKEGLAKKLAVQSTLTFEELEELTFELQREETKAVAREGEGFRKLATYNEPT